MMMPPPADETQSYQNTSLPTTTLLQHDPPQMRSSRESDRQSTLSHVSFNDEVTRHQLDDTPRPFHSAAIPGSTAELVDRSSPSRSNRPEQNSQQPEQDSQSLTNRYQKALGIKSELSSSTRSLRKKNPENRQNIVGVGAEASLSTEDEQRFDWDDSGESELDEYEREERKKVKLQAQYHNREHEHHLHRAKRLRKVYLSLMRISRPIRTALFLFVGCSIAITPAIVAILCLPATNLKIHILMWSLWASINIATSCIISVLVDFFPAVVIKLFFWFYGSASERLKTQVELWMGVRTWTKIALSLTAYWVALLVMFLPIFPFAANPQLGYFDWIKRVAAACFGTGLVLLAEKILLQIIKVNFHKTSLKDRLEENDKALRALDKLAAAKEASKSHMKSAPFSFSHFGTTPKAQTPAKIYGSQTPSANKPGKPLGSTVVDVPMAAMIPHMNSTGLAVPEGVSAAQLTEKLRAEARKKEKRSNNLFNMTDQFTQAIANVTLKDANRNVDYSLESAVHSAKKLARKLFEGLDEDKGGVLTRDEFEPYFKNPADAAEAFKMFDKDGNGDISRKEMRNAVSRIYRERRALATSLKDMSSAVSKLDGVLLGMAFLIAIFIWLFVFNPKGTTTQLVPMATIILGFSFVFGNAAKNLFESMLFIFSIHPYDVGDLVFIDDSPMFVLEFGLFSTTFQRVDGQVIVAPNSVLFSQKYILNVRRSGPMWETTNLMVSFDTPLEVLHEFRARLRQFVMDNPREWKGGLDVNIDFMQNQNLIQLVVAMEHKSNWQDWGARWDRRTLLMKEIKKIMDSLNITYKLPIQPVSFTSTKSTSAPKLSSRSHEQFMKGSPRTKNFKSSVGSANSTMLGNAGRLGTNANATFGSRGLNALGIQPNRF